nr:hypothetical protein [Pandoravirus aubagnensis]
MCGGKKRERCTRLRGTYGGKKRAAAVRVCRCGAAYTAVAHSHRARSRRRRRGRRARRDLDADVHIINSRFGATPIAAGAPFRGQKATPKVCSLPDLWHAATLAPSFLPNMFFSRHLFSLPLFFLVGPAADQSSPPLFPPFFRLFVDLVGRDCKATQVPFFSLFSIVLEQKE